MLRQHNVDLNVCFHDRAVKATPELCRVAGMSVRLMPRHPMTLLLCGVLQDACPMFGGGSGGPLFSTERNLFWNDLNSFLSFFSASSFPLPLPFSCLSFSFEGTLTLLFEFFFTRRERDVEGSARQKKETLTEIQKGNTEALSLFKQVAEDTDNKEGVL